MKHGIIAPGARCRLDSQGCFIYADPAATQNPGLKVENKAKPTPAMNNPTDPSFQTVPQILADAMQHHSAGRLTEAERLYRNLLETDASQPDALHLLGVIALQSGKYDQAIDLINRAIAIKPDFAEAYNNLGTALRALRRLDEAMIAYQNALTYKPDFIDAHFNLGTALVDKGLYAEAATSYQKVLGFNPEYTTAYYSLGQVLQQMGEPQQAIPYCQKAIALQPKNAGFHFSLGTALSATGAFSDAVSAFLEATNLNPTYAEAYNHLANAYKDTGQLKAAIDAYQQLSSLAPNVAEVQFEIGNLFKTLNQPTDAKAAYEKALTVKPEYPEAMINLGILLRDLGNHDAAQKHINEALRLAPNSIEGHNNLGLIYKDKGQPDEAIRCYQKAISIKPDYEASHANLAFALFAKGEAKQGLIENEWRLRNRFFTERIKQIRQPLWNGETPLDDKRLYIWAEQGPQDMTIWSSCLPIAANRTGRCIVAPPQKLVALFKRSFPDVEVRADNLASDTVPSDFDTHLPMGSLFRYFLENPSNEAPIEAFLVPNPERVDYWRKRLKTLGDGPFVGISWKSPVITLRRSPNYTQIKDWAKLFKQQTPVFINLQSTDFEDDISAVQHAFGATVHNFDDLDQFNDLDDVAALSKALDLAISVSTAVAAITAGVGTPTWVVSWRQSPWNNFLLAPRGPNVRFFQRNTHETWGNVFDKINQQLSQSQF